MYTWRYLPFAFQDPSHLCRPYGHSDFDYQKFLLSNILEKNVELRREPLSYLDLEKSN